MKDRLVEGERGFFVASAQQSFTLPSRYYLEPDILQQETQKIFLRSWLYVGHISDLPELGSYMTMELAGQPIVVILGQNKELRVFFNVCQHRGHILLDGRGQVKNRIVCPYHAWCYGLDGELKTARLTRDVPEFERADFGLKIVQRGSFEKPRSWQYVVRVLGHVLSVPPLMLGVVWGSFNHEHRTWHDMLAGTVVLQTRPAEWYWKKIKAYYAQWRGKKAPTPAANDQPPSAD